MAFVVPEGANYNEYTLDRSAGGSGVPVNQTWYEVCDVYGHGTLVMVMVHREDDDAAAKNIQLRFTLDGVATDDGDASINDDTDTYAFIQPYPDSLVTQVALSTSVFNAGRYAGIPFNYNCKVEIRNNQAQGANPELRCVVIIGGH